MQKDVGYGVSRGRGVYCIVVKVKFTPSIILLTSHYTCAYT